jgi:hypothetical protein
LCYENETMLLVQSSGDPYNYANSLSVPLLWFSKSVNMVFVSSHSVKQDALNSWMGDLTQL